MGLGFAAYWLVSIAAIGGVIVLRRRDIPVYPLLAPIVTAVIGIALTFGSVRYRAPADVSIVLLAAVAIASVTRTGPGPELRSRADSPAAATDGETAPPRSRARSSRSPGP